MAGPEDFTSWLQLPCMWRPMMVNTFTGMATPTDTTENLVGLWVVLRLFEKVAPGWTLFVVMASDGFLIGWSIRMLDMVQGLDTIIPQPTTCCSQEYGTNEASLPRRAP